MENTPFFGGTAYLAMPFNEKFRELVFTGIERYGTNFGASRNNNVTLEVFALAESKAAERCLAEDSIIVSSGYLACQLVVQHHLGDCEFIYAPDTHPALWIGKPEPPRMSFSEWSENTVRLANKSDKPLLVISNSLNNLVPEIYSFDWLEKINPGRKVTLLVDDSHGIGITGAKGEGVYSRIPQSRDVEVVVVASMAKALGVDAGLIVGKKSVIARLRNSPVYAGASPPSPGALHAYITASDIYLAELEKLRTNMRFFASFIEAEQGISYLDDFPVYLIKNSKAAGDLSKQGIIISSFAYPDPAAEALNRVVLNSGHTKADIRKLVSALLEPKR